MSAVYFYNCLVTEFETFYSGLAGVLKEGAWNLDRITWFIICALPLHDINNASFIYDFAAYILAEVKTCPRRYEGSDLLDLIARDGANELPLFEFSLPDHGRALAPKMDIDLPFVHKESTQMYNIMKFISRVLFEFLPLFVSCVYDEITERAPLQSLQEHLLRKASLPSAKTSATIIETWKSMLGAQKQQEFSKVVEETAKSQSKSSYSNDSHRFFGSMDKEGSFIRLSNSQESRLKIVSEPDLQTDTERTFSLSFNTGLVALNTWKILRLFWSGKTPGGMALIQQHPRAFINVPRFHHTILDPAYTLKGTSPRVTATLVSLDVLNAGWRTFLGLGALAPNAPQLLAYSSDNLNAAKVRESAIRAKLASQGTRPPVYPKCITQYLQDFKDFKHPRRKFLAHFLARALPDRVAPTLEPGMAYLAQNGILNVSEYNSLPNQRWVEFDAHFKFYRRPERSTMPSCSFLIKQSLDETMVDQFIPTCPYTKEHGMTTDIEDLHKTAMQVQKRCCADLARENDTESEVRLDEKMFDTHLRTPIEKWAKYARS